MTIGEGCSGDLRAVMDTQTISITSVSKHFAWTGGLGIILALLNSCLIFCLLPQHNILLEPQYWYEFMTISVIGFIGLFAAGFVLNISVWMDLDDMCTWKNVLIVYLISGSGWISLNSSYYQVWLKSAAITDRVTRGQKQSVALH